MDLFFLQTSFDIFAGKCSFKQILGCHGSLAQPLNGAMAAAVDNEMSARLVGDLALHIRYYRSVLAKCA
jgi:hypothetical protein